MPDPQVEQWRGLVSQYFPPNAVDTMLWVMGHESGGDPNNWAGKANGAPYTDSNAHGLFQVLGGSLDPTTNVQQAAQKFNNNVAAGLTGFEHWGGGTNTYTTNWGPLSANNLAIYAQRGDTPPVSYLGTQGVIQGGPQSPARSGAPSQAVSYTQPAAPSYNSPQDRYDFLTRQQAQGGQLGPDALSFLANYGGGAPGPGLVAPGSQYQTEQQRYDYLQNLQSRGVPISADAQAFLSGYQPQVYGGGGKQGYPGVPGQAEGITPPSTGDAGLAAQQANPYGYIPSGGMYGNQTTANNMQAQDVYQQNYLNAVQATTPTPSATSSYDPNSGAYNATFTNAAGVGTNVGGYAGGGGGYDAAASPAGAGGGGTFENAFSEFAKGGTATAGKGTKTKLLPTAPVGVPFMPPQPVPLPVGTTALTAQAGGPFASPAPAGGLPSVSGGGPSLPLPGAGVPLGAPNPYMQMAGGGTVTTPHPILAIDEVTKHPLFEAGEAGQEKITVTPMTRMADGGEAVVGPLSDAFNHIGAVAQDAVAKAWLAAHPEYVPPEVLPPPEKTDWWHYNPPADYSTNRIFPPVPMPINGPESGAPPPWPPIGSPRTEGEYLRPYQNWPPEWMPPDARYANGGKAVVGYQEGGDATVGDPNDPNKQPTGGLFGGLTDYLNTNLQQAPVAPPSIPMPDYSGYGDPNALKLQNQGAYLNSQLSNIPNQQNYLNAQGNVYNTQAANFPTQQNYLGALGNVYQAQQGTIGPQQNYISAQGNVIGAQGQETQAQRGYIGQQQGVNQQQQTNEARLQAAQQNIPDLAAAGAMQNQENNTDYLYRYGGMTPPVDVETMGQPLPPGSPAGVRPKVESRADVIGQKNQMFNRTSALTLEGARLAVQLLGTNVDLARQEAAKVGLTVDQAKLLVQQASNQADVANLAVRQGDLTTSEAQNQANLSNLNVRQGELNTSQLGLQNQISELPPRSGLTTYTNPFTGASQYMTPAEAAIQRQADGNALGTGSADTQQALTDAGIAPTTAQAAKPYAKMTPTQIAKLFKDGQVDKDVAIAAILAKGYPYDYAQEILQINLGQLPTEKGKGIYAPTAPTGGGGAVRPPGVT